MHACPMDGPHAALLLIVVHMPGACMVQNSRYRSCRKAIFPYSELTLHRSTFSWEILTRKRVSQVQLCGMPAPQAGLFVHDHVTCERSTSTQERPSTYSSAGSASHSHCVVNALGLDAVTGSSAISPEPPDQYETVSITLRPR